MLKSMRRLLSPIPGVLVALLAGPASADIDTKALHHTLGGLPDRGARLLSAFSDNTQVPLLVRVTSRSLARAERLVPITDTLAIGRKSPELWQDLLRAEGILSASVGPNRALQLDRIETTVRLNAAYNQSGLMGEGSLVGVIDTGADSSHLALRDAEGNSRIAWLLAFGEEPRGLHPELEESYGCVEVEPCAVLSAQDINEILASGNLARLPKDHVGHGTHVASLAAGRDATYPGIAPQADLIVIAALSETGGVSDARILLGTKFIFDRAFEMARPAVVNLSLGSSFGAHDGTSSLELGLAELARGPGRAIVIASGNSADVLYGLSGDYPEPLGIHTEVAVLPTSSVRVPFLSPTKSGGSVDGGIFIWLSTRPGERISVAFSNGQGAETRLVGAGQSLGFSSESFNNNKDEYDGFIVNGIDNELNVDVMRGSVVVGLVGKWSSGRAFELVLQGHANARMWISGTQGASPGKNGHGPLFPRARSQGTVAVPGSHRSLITVGSTINRTVWEDYLGRFIGYENDDAEGERSPFSGAGPNQNGALKPELVAPGSSVIGAMAREADPRTSLLGVSQFSSFGTCPDEFECLVIDDEHGIASGTSMSAPLVTGAVALLMQRDPELTMEKAKHYLMAGAAEVRGQSVGSMVGAGGLDLVGALLAQERDLSSEHGAADAHRSRVVWAEQFVYPAPGPALEGYLLLRDARGEPVSVGENHVEIFVKGPGKALWDELSPGLLALQLTADEGSAGSRLVVTTQVNRQLLSRQTIPIERDPTLAAHGYELTGGTCQLMATSSGGKGYLFLLFVLTGWVSRRYHQQRRQVQYHPAQH